MAATPPPSFLHLAGHPVRWQLLSQLARSDRRVRELCALLGAPQALVSYHLARLRTEGLVSARRSIADGRNLYYSLDLGRCRELLGATGAALHPALRPARTARALGSARTARARRRRARVLFLCTGNSARSQMAERLAEELGDGAIVAFSAGSHPKPLHPEAVRVMGARGLDLDGHRPKPIGELAGRRFDWVVSLCDRVREVCPELPGPPRLVHWSLPDPAREGTPEAFERTADELAERIPFLLDLIEEES